MIGELVSKSAEIRIAVTYLQWQDVVASRSMKEYKVGQTVAVKLSGGGTVEATITAIRQTRRGTVLRVSFDNKTVLIYESEIVARK